MIQLTELRVGNTILKNNETITISITDLSQIEAGNENFYPVMLTTNVLEAYSFDKEEIEYIGNLWVRHPLQLLEEEGFWYVNAKLKKLLQVHTLHQLQNLYFALKGEELIAKL